MSPDPAIVTSWEVAKKWLAKFTPLRVAFRWRWLQMLGRMQRDLTEKFGTEVTRQLGGFWFRFDLTEVHDVGQFHGFLRGQTYEPETVTLMREKIKSGQVFVDVGANNGMLTFVAAALVGPHGRVIAFEPNPKARNRLLRNLTLNPQFQDIVSSREIALSDSSGRITLFLSPIEDGLTSALPPIGGGGHPISVDCARLDQVLESQRVDWVKIDVEGLEAPVVRGMSGLLEFNPSLQLIVEWNPEYGNVDLWNALSRSFRLYRIKAEGSSYALLEIRSFHDTRYLPLCNLYGTSILDNAVAVRLSPPSG